MKYITKTVNGEPNLIAKIGKAKVTVTFTKDNTKNELEVIKASLLESYEERIIKGE